jgi:cellobiose-specific phosphotransferase system component IIB|tara:strand:+ start:1874 stop:2158 length:285 start_codon:yes stop_codon:yes gene_type:complete
MTEINVENMEDNADLFMEKMGFAHDTEGLELSDDQLVNFLLICHQMEYGVGEEEEEEEGEDMKVKVIKMHGGGDMTGLIDEVLGHGGPEIKGRY